MESTAFDNMYDDDGVIADAPSQRRPEEKQRMPPAEVAQSLIRFLSELAVKRARACCFRH